MAKLERINKLIERANEECFEKVLGGLHLIKWLWKKSEHKVLNNFDKSRYYSALETVYMWAVGFEHLDGEVRKYFEVKAIEARKERERFYPND